MTLGRGVLITVGVLGLAVAAVAYAGPRPPQPPAAPAAARAPEPPGTPAPDVHKKVIIFRSGGSWLGVQIADVDADRARDLGMKEEAGAEVQAVSPGSPAEKAGLEKGDVILEYQGTRVEGVSQLTRLVRETPAGRSANLKVFRDGSTRTFTVKVGERSDREAPEAGQHVFTYHGDGEGNWVESPDVPDIPEIPNIDIRGLEDLDNIPGLLEMRGFGGRPRLGAEVDDVGPQLAGFFGLKQDGGVLVKSVKKGSAGDNAGLKAGDVIVRVDDETVEDTSDLSLALRQRRDKEVKLTVVRDRREQSMTIPPAPPADSEGTPRGHRHGGAPAAFEQSIRDYQRALELAAQAQAANLVDVNRVREDTKKAIEESRRALEQALRDAAAAAAAAAAPEANIEEEDTEDAPAYREDVEAPAPRAPVEVTPVSDSDRDAIRRAVEEARRIRIGTQND